ncbi:hypothetical protein N405_05145 [Helicobacter pylori FD568]|nr:hypothetical protein N405_05145 [Helicobacter pylori FD568]
MSFWKKCKENLRNHFYNKPKTIKVKTPFL